MKDTLVLFTSIFPYQSGEFFLETEIEFLAKEFKKIIIVPRKASSQNRKVPKNVFINDFIINSKTRRFNKFKGIFSKYFFSNFTLRVKELKYLFHNAIYVKRYKKLIELILKSNNIENCLFYTYWFGAETSTLSLVKKKMENIVFVTRVHRGDLYENVHGLKTFPNRQKVLQNINRIFSISADGKKHLLNKYNIAKEKICVSRLGTLNISKQISRPDNKLSLVSCSNIVEVKRIDLIVNTLTLLKTSDIKIYWTHIGDGYLRDSIEKQAAKNLQGSIKYKFQGRLSNKNVLKFYENNAVDVFINTSRSEGIPVSIMEAQSFGIPVIATDVGGTSEIVNNDNGFLLRNNPTVKEIADVILDVLTNKEKWKEKRILSYNNWQKNYNAEINYSNFVKELKDLT